MRIVFFFIFSSSKNLLFLLYWFVLSSSREKSKIQSSKRDLLSSFIFLSTEWKKFWFSIWRVTELSWITLLSWFTNSFVSNLVFIVSPVVSLCLKCNRGASLVITSSRRRQGRRGLTFFKPWNTCWIGGQWNKEEHFLRVHQSLIFVGQTGIQVVCHARECSEVNSPQLIIQDFQTMF